MTFSEVCNSLKTTDKNTDHSYGSIYDRLINVKQDVSLLEVGVFNGGSLLVWSQLFKDVTHHIEAIDIASIWNARKEFQSQLNVKINWESDSTLFTCDRNFDYIIDDGCHLPEAQLKTFLNLFKYLNEGGVYFIEDIKIKCLTYLINEISKHCKLNVYIGNVNERSDDCMIYVRK